ncbi:hypothetical protein F2Q69_00012047 [Brassica cretica]|uniref:Uncharacterized protein n=1 Tax=Brassica cretica TaxID=69181 RepID=A0A8S9QS23_BRACR|nr:hypothetical protein F2Q69_00012047 [Brassica cretica]
MNNNTNYSGEARASVSGEVQASMFATYLRTRLEVSTTETSIKKKKNTGGVLAERRNTGDNDLWQTGDFESSFLSFAKGGGENGVKLGFDTHDLGIKQFCLFCFLFFNF